MATAHVARPSWYTDEDDSAWEKVKAAFRRDWTQTKHDFGADEPDLNQRAADTVRQAAGSKAIPPDRVKTPHADDRRSEIYLDDEEPAYRYGYAASRHFDQGWDEGLEGTLRDDWGDESAWERHRHAVRRGYLYGKNQHCGPCDQ